MAWQDSFIVVLAVFSAFCGGSCHGRTPPDAAVRTFGERWVLVGEYTTPREKAGPPKENWIGTFRLPDGILGRLVDTPMSTPDGETVFSPKVAYNEPRQVLICASRELPGPSLCDDVWRYDRGSGQSRWIAKGRWNNTRGFAWSPDGRRVAFVASTRGQAAAFVVQYDLDVDKLEEVAGDAFGNRDDPQEGDSAIRPRRPVYSDDGNGLYYVSMDQHVMRVNLRTRRSEQLPFTRAVAVLAVRGGHLVYAKEVARGRDARFQVVKVSLDASDDLHGEEMCAMRGVLWGNYVSPSRRFILLTARAGYGSETRLLDVDQGVSSRAEGLLGGQGFTPHSTVWGGDAVP